MSPPRDRGVAPRVVVDLEPQRLTQLLRRMFATRGVATVDPTAAPREHIDVALLRRAPSGGLDATFIVRLEEAGWNLPANAVIEAGDPAGFRVVEISELDELVELIMNLALD